MRDAQVLTLREQSVRTTIERFAPMKRPAGITRIADVTGLDRIGIPVFSSVRPAARSVSVSMGKGDSRELAWISALMEGLELHVAESSEAAIRVKLSADELRSSGQTFHLEGLLNETAVGVANRTIGWLIATDLETSEPVLVPELCVSADYTRITPRAFQNSTNGLASGLCIDDATNHALLEIIERDALTLWYRTPIAARIASGLDTATVDCSRCADLMARFEAAGVLLRVFGVQGAAGVPVFIVFAIDADASAARCVRWTAASGAHQSRSVALRRALTELAQVRLTLIVGSREDVPAGVYCTDLGDEALRLALIGGRRALQFDEISDFGAPGATPAEELSQLVRGLRDTAEDAGDDHRVLRVVLECDDIDIPCVKVFATGLENPGDERYYRPGPRARRLDG